MATYNGEKYIREQLESIGRQNLLPCELVVTDDGSTDATLALVGEYARAAPFPVRIHRNSERLGYADNFLKAASLCEGDLIAFCDQDDIWMEQKLSTCAGFFADPEVLLAIHSSRTLTPNGRYGPEYPRFHRTGVRGPRDPFDNRPGFSMVIRREVIMLADNTQRPERLWSHDHWIWFLAASAGAVATVARPLVIYRQHGNNAFGAPSNQSILLQAQSAIATLEYDTSAEFEEKCSQKLRTIAELTPDRAGRLIETAQQLERRAALHRTRTRIYARESGFLRRARTWARIFLQGGYWPDGTRTRLGPKAGLKDLVFGVTGAHRWNAD